jgi:hypothetical protein
MMIGGIHIEFVDGDLLYRIYQKQESSEDRCIRFHTQNVRIHISLLSI